MLREVWGEELPPGPHPELTVLIDAIAIDDDHAATEQLISCGDGITYRMIAALYIRGHPTDTHHRPHLAFLSDGDAGKCPVVV